MKKRVFKSFVTTGILVGMLSTAAYAGTSYGGYNTTVGRFGGSGYSGYQTKTNAGISADIKSGTVGGKYTVKVRTKCTNGNGSWVKNLNDGTYKSLPVNSNVKKGNSVRLEFANDLTTRVDVQVSGQWRSN